MILLIVPRVNHVFTGVFSMEVKSIGGFSRRLVKLAFSEQKFPATITRLEKHDILDE